MDHNVGEFEGVSKNTILAGLQCAGRCEVRLFHYLEGRTPGTIAMVVAKRAG